MSRRRVSTDSSGFVERLKCVDALRNQSRGFSGLSLNPEPVRDTADTRASLASGSTVEQAADLDGEQEEDKGHLVFPWEWPENVWDEIFHSMGAAAGQVQQLVRNLILTCPISC